MCMYVYLCDVFRGISSSGGGGDGEVGPFFHFIEKKKIITKRRRMKMIQVGTLYVGVSVSLPRKLFSLTYPSIFCTEVV